MVTSYKSSTTLQLEDNVEMSDDVEQKIDSLTNRDDILKGKDRGRELRRIPLCNLDILLYFYKNALRLHADRYTYRKIITINVLFSALHTTPFVFLR